MDVERVLSRVQKLLNVTHADNVRFEDEANNALVLAHKLLKKHHLTMSQVMDIDPDNRGASNFFELKEDIAAEFKANDLPIWMSNVIITVNKLTDTKALIKRSPRADKSCGNLSIVFVGDCIDVNISLELFNFIRKTITKLSTNHKKEVEGNFKNWRSFAEGCSNRILERAKLEKQKTDQKFGIDPLKDEFEHSIGNYELDDEEEYEDLDDEIDDIIKDEKGLVLYKQYQDNKINSIAEYIENQCDSEEKTSNTSKVDNSSFELGEEAGEEVPLKLRKQVTKKTRS